MPRGRASRFSTPCGSIPASVAGRPVLAGVIDDPDVVADAPARHWRTMGARGYHSMRRRTLLGTALAMANASPLLAALRGGRWEDAAEVLERAVAAKKVESAVLSVTRRDESFTRHFAKAASGDAMFLLGSISKPINVTAVMTLFDRGEFRLDDRVTEFLPAFTEDGRGEVTIR